MSSPTDLLQCLSQEVQSLPSSAVTLEGSRWLVVQRKEPTSDYLADLMGLTRKGQVLDQRTPLVAVLKNRRFDYLDENGDAFYSTNCPWAFANFEMARLPDQTL